MKIIILLLLIVLLYISLNNNEHLTDTPTEAIQNIASMYNNGNVITNKIQLSDKWSLSGVGDNVGGTDNKDDWLRLADSTGKNLYGGMMIGKLNVDKDTEIKGNLKLGQNLITPTIKSDGDKIKIGKDDKTNDVFIPRKWYTIGANFGGADLHYWPKSKISLEDAKKYCNTRHDCTRLGENNDTIWFKYCNSGNNIVAGKDWPDEMVGCGGATDGSAYREDSANVKSLDDCKKKCKDAQDCDYAQYDIWERRCYLRKNDPSGIKTHFANKL